MTPLVYTMPRGTAQIDDISTWLPPSLHTPWRNVFFEYIKKFPHLCWDLNLQPLAYEARTIPQAVADPGFPIGGCGPIWGAVDLQQGCFSVKMYVKMKELGPVGGMHLVPPQIHQ